MPRSDVLSVDGLDVEVTFRRVRRMNVRVHAPHGDVRLSAPPGTSERAVLRFVRECRAWIDRQRERVLDETRAAGWRAAPSVPRGVPGEVWWRFGRALRLEVDRAVPSARTAGVATLPGGRLVVRVPDPSDGAAVLAAIDRWQRRELRTAATGLLDHWAGRMGVRYRFLGVRRMTTRWGSCVPDRGRIWLNLALVVRPPSMLEYVVVHELAHLIEPSHGPAFQAVMDRHLPDWRERRSALQSS